MIITFSPIRSPMPFSLARQGDALIIGDTSWDLSDPALDCPWIVGQPTKQDGIWQVTVLLPHGPFAPPETLFPAPVSVPTDGPVPLPLFEIPPVATDTMDDDGLD